MSFHPLSPVFFEFSTEYTIPSGPTTKPLWTCCLGVSTTLGNEPFDAYLRQLRVRPVQMPTWTEMTMGANPTDFERMFPDWPMPRVSPGGRVEVGAIGGTWEVFDERGHYLGTRAPGGTESTSGGLIQRLMA
jgi:hypothetical protein